MIIHIQERTTCFLFEHYVHKGRDSNKEALMCWEKVACDSRRWHLVFALAGLSPIFF